MLDTFLTSTEEIGGKWHLQCMYYKDKYQDEMNDLTPEVIKNLAFIGIDYLIPIGGDDTLGYGAHLASKDIPVIGIPKTMDNDPYTCTCMSC